MEDINIKLTDNKKDGLDLIINGFLIETGNIENSYFFWQKLKTVAKTAIEVMEAQRNEVEFCQGCFEPIEDCTCKTPKSKKKNLWKSEEFKPKMKVTQRYGYVGYDGQNTPTSDL
jgi:hypothetical protein